MYPNFYNENTSAQPIPPIKKTLKQKFRELPLWKKLGAGCIVSIGLLLWGTILCGLCSVVTSSGAPQPTPQQVAHQQSTQTPVPTRKVATIQPTKTPTPAPTATPKPQPTPTTAPTPTPVPVPTAAPAPTQPPARAGLGGNPYGYDLNPGSLIYQPPDDLCLYISCIPSYAKGGGYVVECVDGMFAKSGGESGSCSHHGGEKQPLYAHS